MHIISKRGKRRVIMGTIEVSSIVDEDDVPFHGVIQNGLHFG